MGCASVPCGGHVAYKQRTQETQSSFQCFPFHAMLTYACQVLEKETCYQEERLNKVCKWTAHPAEHLEVTIPKVNPEYAGFKANQEAKAAAAPAKASKASQKKAPATKSSFIYSFILTVHFYSIIWSILSRSNHPGCRMS